MEESLKRWARRERWMRRLTVSLQVLSLLGMWVVLAALWFSLWAPSVPALLGWVLVTLTAVGGFLFLKIRSLSRGPVLSLEGMALHLERTFRVLDSRLLSSVQLRTAAPQSSGSPELVSELRRSTEKTLSELPAKQAFPRRPVWISLGALAVTAVLLIGAGWRFPQALTLAVTTLSDGRLWRQAAGLLEIHGAARDNGDWTVGNLRITVRSPAYAKLPLRTDDNTDGTIRALKGSSVQVAATASSAVSEAKLIFSKGEPVGLQVTGGGRQISAEFQVMEEGDYAFKAADKTSKRYPIQMINDELPKATLLQPEHALEVNENSVVDVEYDLGDDFGLSRVALVVERGGAGAKSQEIALESFSDIPRQKSGRYRWNLSELHLDAGESMAFFVRVYDNDTVSGPKAGESARMTLNVTSREKLREKMLARQETLFNEAVQGLGDALDFSQSKGASTVKVTARWQGLATGLGEIIQSLKENRNQDNEAEGLKIHGFENLQKNYKLRQALWQKGAPPELSAELTALENDTLKFERLMYGEKMDMLLDQSKQVFDRLDRLKDALDKAKKGDLDAAQKALEEFSKNYERYLDKIAQTMESTPSEEFVNPEALKAFQKESIAATLENIKRMLAAGDVEGARKEMEKLQAQMDEMKKNLESSTAKKQAEMAAKVHESLQKLDEVIEGQKKLLNETEKIQRSIQGRHQKEQGQEVKAWLAKQLQRLREIRTHLSEWHTTLNRDMKAAYLLKLTEGLEIDVQEALNDVERALKREDFQEALPAAEEAIDLLERQMSNGKAMLEFSKLSDAEVTRKLIPLGQSVEKAKAIAADLKTLQAKSSPQPNGVEQQRLGELEKAQQGLRRRAMDLSDSMKDLSKEMPFLKPEVFGEEKGDERMPEMKRAADELKKGDAPGAAPQERSALYRLQDARQKIQKSLQEMQRQSGGSSGGNLGGSAPQNANPEHVEIPGADAYKVPENYRQEIIDAMKKPAPKNYEKLNKDYYERLVK